MEQVTLNVQGMSCGHCVKAVETSVSQLAGVEAVHVDLPSATVVVTFDVTQVNVEQIKTTIDDQGYDVVS